MQENPHFLFNNGAWRIYFFVPCSTKLEIAMKKRTLLGCLLTAALPSLLNAQEGVRDSLHSNLQEVEIMSIRATKTTPVAYTNIGRDELKKQNSYFIADLMNKQENDK